MACLNVLKQEIKAVEAAFHKTHDRYLVQKALFTNLFYNKTFERESEREKKFMHKIAGVVISKSIRFCNSNIKLSIFSVY